LSLEGVQNRILGIFDSAMHAYVCIQGHTILQVISLISTAVHARAVDM